MTAEGYIGDRHHAGDEGVGWSGISVAEKNRAAGRLIAATTGRLIAVADVRLRVAVRNANRVVALHGSGHWTGVR